MISSTKTPAPGHVEQTTIGPEVRAWRVYDEDGRPCCTTTSYEQASAISASILGEDERKDT